MKKVFFMGVFRLVVIVLLPLNALAASPKIPPALAPWVDWTMHGHEQELCRSRFDDPSAKICAWPGRLLIDVRERSADFSQKWRLFTANRITLPGGGDLWPEDVSLDGKPLAVIRQNGRPAARIAAGEHIVRGHFLWDRSPGSIAIDPGTVLVRLTRNGSKVRYLDRDRDGRVWLTARQRSDVEKNSLDIRVFRLLTDDLPFLLTTRLKLQVTGQARQQRFVVPRLADFIPMSLASPLPARIESDGSLLVQLAPGVWEITLVSRSSGRIKTLKMPGNPETPWPAQEVWSFAARPDLRLVDLRGLDPVDPVRTGVPAAWKKLPAFVVRPGKGLEFIEKRRGDADPPRDRVNIKRIMWLDMDGGGYTFHDQLTGMVNRGWRLSADKINLGRVAIDGRDQLITRMDGRSGVEIRRGALNIVADGRIDRAGDLPAAGWRHDVNSLSMTLNLPPGWLVLSASGVDRIRSWTGRWTLLDIFMVLIITLAVARLLGWARAGIIFFTLVIIYHEPGAPRWLWLNILAAMAILKVKAEGWPATVATWWGRVFLILLLLVSVPFMAREVRLAIYPQLELHRGVAYDRQSPAVMPRKMNKRAVPVNKVAETSLPESVVGKSAGPEDKTADISSRSRAGRGYSLSAYDPGSMIQTGPGLPRWRWHTYNLAWDGPVRAGQVFSLILLPPGVHAFIRVLRALFLLGMLFILGQGLFPSLSLRRLRGAAVGGAVILTLFCGGNYARAADFPSPALLSELRARLTEPAPCRDNCVDISRLRITLGKHILTARARYSLVADRFVPLPLTLAGWRVEEIIAADKPLNIATTGKDGLPLIPLKSGVTEVVFRGPSPRRTNFTVNLPINPGRVEIDAPGWKVEGLRENGRVQGALSFVKESRGDEGNSLAPGVLPPFLEVRRTLKLGLDWQVLTEVRRLSPIGSPVVAAIDLIPGEAVTSGATEVHDRKAIVRMGPRTRRAVFSSRLEKSQQIVLTAPLTSLWREVWFLSIGPSLHVETSGLTPVHHQDRQGNWNPAFRPWPGESLTLTVTRPVGIKGDTLTIDQVRVKVSPGRHQEETRIDLDLRSSRGGQYLLPLPPAARVGKFAINGRSMPLRIKDDKVVVDLAPGARKVFISFTRSLERRFFYHTPVIDLVRPAVNLFVSVNQPRDRWLLFCAGPAMGPAVLFWGEIVVIFLLAMILAKSRIAPLRFHDWLLLGLGLSQVPFGMALVVAGWLIALAAREKKGGSLNGDMFNLSQIGLVILTFAAMVCLFAAIKAGLLGRPDMMVGGNSSSGILLKWYQDRTAGLLPRPLMVSVPMWVYRVLMLAWALWMARSLINWLRWGWGVFSAHGIWQESKGGAGRENKKENDEAAEDLPELIPEDDVK